MKNIFKKLSFILLVFLPQFAFASDTTFGINMGNLFNGLLLGLLSYSAIIKRKIIFDQSIKLYDYALALIKK